MFVSSFNHLTSPTQDIALIRNNAHVGAQIARELAQLRQRSPGQPHQDRTRELGLGNLGSERKYAKVEGAEEPDMTGIQGRRKDNREKEGVVVVGAAILDLTAKLVQSNILVRK